jgi:zeta-carotene isomerase
LGEQTLADWATFTVAVSAVLGVEYYFWLYNLGPQLGYHLVDTISAACSGNSMLTFSVLFTTFGAFHSGLAALRPAAEEMIGARTWRYIFALTSLPLAFSCITYFLNHR